MERIYKYELDIRHEQIVDMPFGAEIIHVGEQKGVLCLWAKVGIDGTNEERAIYIIGTGQMLKSGLKHIGSVVMSNGFVWHIHEKGNGVKE